MRTLALVVALTLAACGRAAPSPDASYGREPQLPAPESGGMPTINPARATSWAEGAAPVAPDGFVVTRFAEGLDHPRWIYVLANGDVLVAESSTRRQTGGGLMGWIRNSVQRRAGALGDSADRITLLRDADHDGVVETRHVFAEHLNQPFGMALVGGYFYVGNTDAVVRFPYVDGATQLAGEGEVVLRLPHREGDNGHWTRNLIANADGTKL